MLLYTIVCIRICSIDHCQQCFFEDEFPFLVLLIFFIGLDLMQQDEYGTITLALTHLHISIQALCYTIGS